jgi:hypothetical protein
VIPRSHTANCLTRKFDPSGNLYLLISLALESRPQIVIHSVLASRILFNLQETFDINLVQETITDFQARVPPGFESVEV